MQVIPVDLARLEGLVCVTDPEIRVNPETGEMRPNARGETVYLVGVAGRRAGTRRAWAIEVQTTKEPVGVVEGTKLTLVELDALSWEMDGRRGMTYRAAEILAAEAIPIPPTIPPFSSSSTVSSTSSTSASTADSGSSKGRKGGDA